MCKLETHMSGSGLGAKWLCNSLYTNGRYRLCCASLAGGIVQSGFVLSASQTSLAVESDTALTVSRSCSGTVNYS